MTDRWGDFQASVLEGMGKTDDGKNDRLKRKANGLAPGSIPCQKEDEAAPRLMANDTEPVQT